jgi:hypothetical protein
MAHFARVIDGTVVDLHVVSNEVITDDKSVEQEKRGQDFLAKLHGYSSSELIQCSYNGNFRGIYPGIGYTYDEANDVFVAPIAEETE